MKTIVLGPPGTGKTHTLLNKVDDYLKTTNPDRIGYFAFTKKAANEAKDRAMKKFNLSDDDLPYFRTLHSLAFRSLGIKKNQVMQKRHYEDLGRKENLFLAALKAAPKVFGSELFAGLTKFLIVVPSLFLDWVVSGIPDFLVPKYFSLFFFILLSVFFLASTNDIAILYS